MKGKSNLLMLAILLLTAVMFARTDTLWVSDGDTILQGAIDDVGFRGELVVLPVDGEYITIYARCILRNEVSVYIDGRIIVDMWGYDMFPPINTFSLVGDNLRLYGHGQVVNSKPFGSAGYIDGVNNTWEVDARRSRVGITVEQYSEGFITGCGVTDCEIYGIALEDNAMAIIDDVNVLRCRVPIFASLNTEISVIDSRVSGTGYRSIELDRCAKAHIFHNEFWEDSVAVVADGVDSLHVARCWFRDIVSDAIWVPNSIHCSIHNNYFQMGGNATWFWTDGDEAIYNNAFVQPQVGVGAEYYPIHIDFFSNNYDHFCADFTWNLDSASIDHNLADRPNQPGIVRYPGPMTETVIGLEGGTENWWDYQESEGIIERGPIPEVLTLNVSPNPFNGTCQLDQTGDIKAYDIDGKLTYRGYGSSLSPDGWPSGRYVICLANKEGRWQTVATYLK
jgi:hypothetical protein